MPATTATSEIDSSIVAGCFDLGGFCGRAMVMRSLIDSSTVGSRRDSDGAGAADATRRCGRESSNITSSSATSSVGSRAGLRRLDDDGARRHGAAASAAAPTTSPARAATGGAFGSSLMSPTMRASRHRWSRMLSSFGASWNARR